MTEIDADLAGHLEKFKAVLGRRLRRQACPIDPPADAGGTRVKTVEKTGKHMQKPQVIAII